MELEETYEEAAVKELREETGIKTNISSLIFIRKLRHKSFDKITNSINNTFRKVYAYEYNGETDDLRVEKGKAISLEFWPINKIYKLNNAKKKIFIASLLEKQHLDIFKKIEGLINE